MKTLDLIVQYGGPDHRLYTRRVGLGAFDKLTPLAARVALDWAAQNQGWVYLADMSEGYRVYPRSARRLKLR